MNKKRNLTEDTSLVTIKNFNELLEFHCSTSNFDRYLKIENVSFDFEIGADFYANIKKNYPTIVTLIFHNCVFLYNVSCENSIFEYSLSFYKSIFKGEADFGHTTFKSEVDFFSAIFENEANFEFTSIEGEAKFRNVIFKGEAKFRNVIFKGKADFGYTTFEGRTSFAFATFKREAQFWFAIFKGKAQFWQTTFKGQTNFLSAEFELKVDFMNTTFEGMSDFGSVKFNDEINMLGVNFLDTLCFSRTRFKKNINFENCNFMQTVELINISSIDDSCALLDLNFRFSNIEKLFVIDLGYRNTSDRFKSSINGNVDFSYCFFKKDSVVILRNIEGFQKKEIHEINFEYANIHGNIVMQDIEYNSLSLENATVMGSISLSDNVKFKHTAGRHTDCVLKHEALKINDNVNFLKYRKREHFKICKDWFQKEEKDRYYLLKYTRNFFNGISETIVILLNLCSNNFGQSWILGVFFTLGVAALSVANLQIKSNDIIIAFDLKDAWTYLPKFWNDTIKFVWLPNTISEESKKLAEASITVFVLGKIAVGFGIYQTVAAFRRHGK